MVSRDLSSFTKLLASEKVVCKQEKNDSDHDDDTKGAKAKCLVGPHEFCRIMKEHWFGVSQCQITNSMDVNLGLSKTFLLAMATKTQRLNPLVVSEGCRLAMVKTKTGKPLDVIIKEMWKHLVSKAKNKKSKTDKNLNEVEAGVLKNWELLKEGQDVPLKPKIEPKIEPKQEPQQEPACIMCKSSLLLVESPMHHVQEPLVESPIVRPSGGTTIKHHMHHPHASCAPYRKPRRSQMCRRAPWAGRL